MKKQWNHGTGAAAGILLLVIVFVVGGMAGMTLDRANPMRDRKPRFERMDDARMTWETSSKSI